MDSGSKTFGKTIPDSKNMDSGFQNILDNGFLISGFQNQESGSPYRIENIWVADSKFQARVQDSKHIWIPDPKTFLERGFLITECWIPDFKIWIQDSSRVMDSGVFYMGLRTIIISPDHPVYWSTDSRTLRPLLGLYVANSLTWVKWLKRYPLIYSHSKYLRRWDILAKKKA